VSALKFSPALDREQLRDVTMGDEELMREVLAALWSDTLAQAAKLGDAVRDGNAEQCMRLAHYSKGACANVGANAAAEIFRRIETDARSRDFHRCAEGLAALSGAMARLEEEVLVLTGAHLSKR